MAKNAEATQENRNAEDLYVIEQEKRLSESLLWQIGQNFYDQQGVEAWRNALVPHYITCNPVIAHAYARVVLGFVEDCLAETDKARQLDTQQPLYIVELGAGAGRFGYLFVVHFLELAPRARLGSKNGGHPLSVPVTYVLTDRVQKTLDFWQEHPALQPLVKAGALDFALYDPIADKEIVLTHSGKTLQAGALKNPLIVLANYFFDTLPQDLFTIERGKLHERLVTLSGPEVNPDLQEPELLDRIDISYSPAPAKQAYYGDKALDEILHGYVKTLADTSFHFPVAAFNVWRQLNEFAGGRLLLLTGDKGYSTLNGLEQEGENDIVRHGGSFSLMVNYHALGAYVESQGGEMLHPPQITNRLTVVALLSEQASSTHGALRRAYVDAIVTFGPDDFFTLVKSFEELYHTLSLEELLAVLRFSQWDPKILSECLPVLQARAPSMSAAETVALLDAIERAWPLYYHIGEETDLAFGLGMFFYALGDYAEALVYFEDSRRLYGDNPHMAFTMAECYLEIGKHEEALASLETVLATLPTHDAARKMRTTLIAVQKKP